MHNDYKIISTTEYCHRLASLMNSAKTGSHVCVAAMVFDPNEPNIAPIIRALSDASKRGVRVTFLFDAHNFLITPKRVPGPLLARKQLPKQLKLQPFKSKLDALNYLKQSGVRCVMTNPPKRRPSNPLAGRSHMKYAVIDSTVFVGGCNLDRSDLIDMMVQFENTKAANWLIELTSKIAKQPTVRHAFNDNDQQLKIDENSWLVIDCGVPRQSLILNKALEFIDNADKYITITCQFFPNDVVAKRLKAAHERGVKVNIIYNNPKSHNFPYTQLMQFTKLRESWRLPADFFENEIKPTSSYIHAKLIATDKGAIVGSHNYVMQGVVFGTAEIALVCTTPEFGQQAVQVIDRQL